MDKNTTSRPKSIDLQKILLPIVFVSITVLLEYIYTLTRTPLPPSSGDIFPAWLSALDTSILLQINPTLIHPLLNTILFIFTQTGRASVIIVVSLLYHYFGQKKEALLIFVSLVIGTITIFLLKEFISRPRPFLTLPTIIPFIKEPGTSFPSGHTTRLFALSAVVSRKFSLPSLGLYVLSFLVAFSRLYLGVHYPLDVLVGGILGWTIGKVTLRAENRITHFVTTFIPL